MHKKVLGLPVLDYLAQFRRIGAFSRLVQPDAEYTAAKLRPKLTSQSSLAQLIVWRRRKQKFHAQSYYRR